MRVRGLKHALKFIITIKKVSHPMRVRGLKQLNLLGPCPSLIVAPHAGAWIETFVLRRKERQRVVAPLTGAWIETRPFALYDNEQEQSHPMRVRGLKLVQRYQ